MISGTSERRRRISEETCCYQQSRETRSPNMSLSSSVMQQRVRKRTPPTPQPPHPHRALLFKRERSQEPHYLAKWLLAPCCLNSAPAALSQAILTVSTLQSPEEQESGSLSHPASGNFIFPGLSRGPPHSPDSDPVNCLFLGAG